MSAQRPDDEIDTEIDFHLREVTETLVAQGWDPQRATGGRAAIRRPTPPCRDDAAASGVATRETPPTAKRHRDRRSGVSLRGSWPATRAGLHADSGRDARAGDRRQPDDVRNRRRPDVTAAELFEAPATVHRVYWQWQDHGKPITSASTQFTRFVDFERDATSFSEIAAFADRTLPVGDGTPRRSGPCRRHRVVLPLLRRSACARPILHTSEDACRVAPRLPSSDIASGGRTLTAATCLARFSASAICVPRSSASRRQALMA